MSDDHDLSSLGTMAFAIACIALLLGVVGLVLPQGADLRLTELNDVYSSGLLANQTLVYNGTAWVNSNFTC